MPAPPTIIPDTSRADWTVDELAQLPDDGNRYEVLDGALLVTPAPSFGHQRASRELVRLLLPYLDGTGLELFYAPAAVRSGPRTEVEPDVLVLPTLARTSDRCVAGLDQLVLAVEITSPSTARVDRYRKRALYQRHGIAEYWVVDPASRFVERWKPADSEPEVLAETLTWRPLVDRAPLVVDLGRYFDAVHGGNAPGASTP
ncbi:MAG: Uma2 family endonuclease [Gemmatimonadaceae bacterium]